MKISQAKCPSVRIGGESRNVGPKMKIEGEPQGI